MKVEEQKKQKRSSDQNEYSGQNGPKGIIARILPLCRRYICGSTTGTIHFFLISGKSILQNRMKSKDFVAGKNSGSTKTENDKMYAGTRLGIMHGKMRQEPN